MVIIVYHGAGFMSVKCGLKTFVGTWMMSNILDNRKLTDDQKVLRIEHSTDIIKEAENDNNYFITLWLVILKVVFSIRSRSLESDCRQAESAGNVYLPLSLQGHCPQRLNSFHWTNPLLVFQLGVLKRLVHRIRYNRAEYREEGSWHLLHDNIPSHPSILVIFD